MASDDIIAEAKKTIGPPRPDDELVDPVGHADMFRANAPSIARVLESSEVRAAAEQQHLAGKQASLKQAQFKRYSKLAASAIVVAAVASAAIMVVGELSPLAEESSWLGQLPRGVSVLLAVLGLAAGTVASICLGIIRGGNSLEQWMKERADAETRRLEYFSAVTAPQMEDPPRLDRLLQLEYFRRFQLDGQLGYYGKRGEEHERAASRALIGSAIMIGLAGLVNAAAGMLGAWDPRFAAIAAIAVVVQALASRITTGEAIGQDARNGERYRRTRKALTGLSGRLDEVRRAIADGNDSALSAFVDAVHEQISVEHRQWIETVGGADAATRRLQGELEKMQAKVDKVEHDPGGSG